jgi:rubrerythrin
MGGIRKTAENLAAAIEGEGFEFQEMYPPYLQQAKDEGDKPAEISFRNALAVEEIHHGLYSQALQAIKAGGDLPGRKIFVCEICGNTVYDNAPDRCPVCGVPKEKFSEIS